jgi:hypothetical protein
VFWTLYEFNRVYVCLCIIYDLVGGFKPSEEYASEKWGSPSSQNIPNVVFQHGENK